MVDGLGELWRRGRRGSRGPPVRHAAHERGGVPDGRMMRERERGVRSQGTVLSSSWAVVLLASARGG